MPWWSDVVWGSNPFNSTKKKNWEYCSALTDRNISDFHHFWQFFSIILAIFAEISLIWFFSTKYRVDPSRYTIYRWYISTFSSLVLSGEKWRNNWIWEVSAKFISLRNLFCLHIQFSVVTTFGYITVSISFSSIFLSS